MSHVKLLGSKLASLFRKGPVLESVRRKLSERALLNSFALGLFTVRVGAAERDIFIFLAVGEHNFVDDSYRRAGFGAKDIHGDRVTGVHHVPGPAKRAQRRR